MRTHWLVLAAGLWGCSVGVDPFPLGSDGSVHERDASLVGDSSVARADAALPGADATVWDASTPVLADAAGGRDAAVPVADAATPPDASDPCEGTVCGANAHCQVPPPHCVCSPGFVSDGGACEPGDPGDPALRTKEQICDAYAKGQQPATPPVFTAGAAQCDPGTLSRSGIDEAVGRLNMHRWFVGLGPVTDGDSDNQAAQACAVISAWNPAGMQAHNPPPTSTCYTALGAQGAGSSNIAWGCGSPGACIDQWMADGGNDSTMGHRRWFLYPPLDPVGIGYYEGGNNYGSASCGRVFQWGGTGPRPAWYAYPSPGFFPMAYASWPWTLHGAIPQTPVLEVTRVSDGQKLDVTPTPLNSGYADEAITIARNGWSPAADETYHVKVSGASGTPVEYDVKPVNCP